MKVDFSKDELIRFVKALDVACDLLDESDDTYEVLRNFQWYLSRMLLRSYHV